MSIPVQLHLPALVAAALGAFVLGAIWYSPWAFGRAWMRHHGVAGAASRSWSLTAYGVALVCQLVAALVLAVLVVYTGVVAPHEGLWLGFLCWLGFLATNGLIGNLFADRSLRLFLIDAGYQLASLSFMGWVLAAWR